MFNFKKRREKAIERKIDEDTCEGIDEKGRAYTSHRNPPTKKPRQQKKRHFVGEPIKESEKPERTIEFCVNDDCFTRAIKLFQYINLGDNGTLSSYMARGIKIYMDLDKELEEHKKATKSKTKKEVK